jgi:hypothetical protein
MLLYHSPHPAHAFPSFARVHRDRSVDRIRQFFGVVGIDDQGILELAGGTGEAAQD